MSTRSVFASLLTAAAGQIALLVSGVVAARLLGVEDRGWLALLVLFPTLLAHVGTMGLPLALTYAVAARGVNLRRAIRAMAVPAAVQTAILVSLNILILSRAMADAPARVLNAAAFSVFGVPAALACVYGLASLQGDRRFRAVNVLRLLPAASYGLGVVMLLVVNAGTIMNVLVMWVATYLGAGIATLVTPLIASGLSSSSQPVRMQAILRFGLKGWVGSLSPIENYRVEQIAVGLLLSPAALGLYAVAGAFSNLPRFAAQSIGLVIYPDMAKADIADRRAILWRYMAIATLACGLPVVALEFLVPWLIPVFFGEDFAGAVSISQILLIGAFLFGLRRVLSGAVVGAGHPGSTALAELSAWISLAVALPVSLRWGPEGVALSVVLAAAVSLAVLVGLVVRQPAWRA